MYVFELLELLARHNPHETDVTNIESIEFSSGQVFFEFDCSDWESNLEDSQKEREELEEQNEKLVEEIRVLTEEKEELEGLLDSFNDGDASVSDYRKETEKCRTLLNSYREAYEDMQKELTALRKRKGVEAGVFKNLAAINSYICEMSKTDERAKILVDKIKGK